MKDASKGNRCYNILTNRTGNNTMSSFGGCSIIFTINSTSLDGCLMSHSTLTPRSLEVLFTCDCGNRKTDR